MSFFVAYHWKFVHDVPDNHRFPMEKYDLIHQQLIYEGLMKESDFLIPNLIDLGIVNLVHSQEYLDKLIGLKCTPKEQRISGFEHTKGLIERELRIVEATRMCAEAVQQGGIALNIAGGTHHAFSDRGEGFCLLNDQAIAAAWLLKNNRANRILIVDLDVHQGNGTAKIFQNSTQVFTFSMHGHSNYPLEKEQSHLDIALADGIGDEDYIQLLEDNLKKVFDQFNPDFVFYQCGVDVLHTDKMGRLKLTQEGVRNRDLVVLNLVANHQLPLVCSMGGGYSKDVKEIVNAHMHVFREGYRIFSEL